MKLTRLIACGWIAAGFSAGALDAQQLRDVQAPAEFPPASFKGSQYVDSKGCAFIRAGIDGNVTWVPRVNRQRKLLCGQTPTELAERASVATPTAQVPVKITVTQPERAPVLQANNQSKSVRPRARTVSKAAQSTKPTPRAVAQMQPVKPVAVKTRVKQEPKAVPCNGASEISQRYINLGGSLPVRCGPQKPEQTSKARFVKSQISRVAATGAGGSAQRSLSQDTRVLPAHVYESRKLDNVYSPPVGYVSVWNDDRLNPRRAEQSLRGIAQTRQVWTNGTPRRWIDQNTTGAVTTYIALINPDTGKEIQQSGPGKVKVIHNAGLLDTPEQVVSTHSGATLAATSNSAPETRKGAKNLAKTNGQYVQVGVFRIRSNAKAAAQRLGDAGLPAQTHVSSRNSRAYRTVLAGPFAARDQLNRALKKARAAGFGDAFIR